VIRVLAALASLAAAWNVLHWLAIIASGVPIGYGEGAVVHAGQILARGGDPYALDPTRFVSANYPPLGYIAVALGLPFGPFSGLRVANVIAACGVAALAAWLARASRWLLAVAFAGAAVVALVTRRHLALFGILGALAVAAKPTALVPLAAVLLYLVWRERRHGTAAALALALAVGAVVAIALVRFDPHGLYVHLVSYNAFPYDLRNPPLLILLAALLLGAYVAVALLVAVPAMRAYLAGAAAVVLLGGHEGATINYLLDLAAASCLAIASSPRPWPRWSIPALTGQLAAAFVLATVGPFAPVSLDLLASRATIARDLPRDRASYAEDSAVLIAAGIEPIIDDSFVWARLVDLGARSDDVTPRVASRSFAAILSDVPLEDIENASELERLRWPPDLARAVLDNYELDASVRGGYRYVPRR
jgi:hypothetical protein